jgi:hypothetical protein
MPCVSTVPFFQVRYYGSLFLCETSYLSKGNYFNYSFAVTELKIITRLKVDVT